MSFHDVRFPTDVSLGSTGGPERRTEIVALANGYEERNTRWAHSRRRFDAGLGLRTLDQVHEAIAFFEARMGRLYAFRWKDWSDYKSCAPSAEPDAVDQPVGEGDGARVRFALSKTYASGTARYVRPISKPVAGTVRAALDGAPLIEGVDFAVDALSGELDFASAPAPGAAITAGFEFDVPARFDTDRIDVNLEAFAAGEIPSLPVVEVRV